MTGLAEVRGWMEWMRIVPMMVSARGWLVWSGKLDGWKDDRIGWLSRSESFVICSSVLDIDYKWKSVWRWIVKSRQ